MALHTKRTPAALGSNLNAAAAAAAGPSTTVAADPSTAANVAATDSITITWAQYKELQALTTASQQLTNFSPAGVPGPATPAGLSEPVTTPAGVPGPATPSVPGFPSVPAFEYRGKGPKPKSVE